MGPLLKNAPEQACILYFNLDCQQKGERYFYIWRHHPAEEAVQPAGSILVDLNNILIPESEIEKLIGRIGQHVLEVRSIAFLNCPVGNQREIKRRLKTHDVRLYSNTAFFADPSQAQQWAAARAVSC